MGVSPQVFQPPPKSAQPERFRVICVARLVHVKGHPVLIDAMAMQISCIATLVGGIPELIRDGVEWLLVTLAVAGCYDGKTYSGDHAPGRGRRGKSVGSQRRAPGMQRATTNRFPSTTTRAWAEWSAAAKPRAGRRTSWTIPGRPGRRLRLQRRRPFDEVVASVRAESSPKLAKNI